MKQVFKFAKNNYLIGSLFFLFWMIFIDSNNLVNQYRLSKQLGDLEDQKEYYQERKEIITAQRQELLSNPDLLEKFAREQYLMKRETEDLYVIVKK